MSKKLQKKVFLKKHLYLQGQKNYAKAIKSAEDGAKTDMKDKPGLAKEWYDWLLKIAQAQKDTPKIIEYARYLQTACRYIRRMIKLGGKAKTDKLIAQLRTLYARRPALMQELDRV